MRQESEMKERMCKPEEEGSKEGTKEGRKKERKECMNELYNFFNLT